MRRLFTVRSKTIMGISFQKKECSTTEVVEYLLKDMYCCSIIYKELIFDSEVRPCKAGEKDPIKIIPWVIYSIVILNQGTTARPLLLLILMKMKNNQISSEQALVMLKGCLSFVFRSKIARYYGITGQSAGNIIRRIEKSKDDLITAFWKAITAGTGKYAFPNDEIFKNELKNRDVYLVLRANGCGYFLYTLERHYVNARGVDDAYPWDSTTDHIMPQTLTEEWIEYLGEDAAKYLEYVHRLGNLALTDYNSNMSNKEYDVKRKWFQIANYVYTTDLCNIQKWGIDKIEERGERLANECLKIWNLPQEYQNNVVQLQMGKRRASFKFSMVGLDKGSVITFTRGHNIGSIVLDDKNVEYEGSEYSLSGLACKLLRRDNVDGPSYFLYRDHPLNDLRAEYEDDWSFLSIDK